MKILETPKPIAFLAVLAFLCIGSVFTKVHGFNNAPYSTTSAVLSKRRLILRTWPASSGGGSNKCLPPTFTFYKSVKDRENDEGIGCRNKQRLQRSVCLMQREHSSVEIEDEGKEEHHEQQKIADNDNSTPSFAIPPPFADTAEINNAKTKLGSNSFGSGYTGPFTNAVLKIAYDGGHFYGWSAANDGEKIKKVGAKRVGKNDFEEYHSKPNGANFLPPIPQQMVGRRKRRKGLRVPGAGTTIRSVEGVLKGVLAKVYGNVDPSRIQVEGCSRTDKGVHARGMVALIYCLTSEASEKFEKTKLSGQNTDTNLIPGSIPGKRLPHPITPNDDSYFETLPFNSDLEKLLFVMNRMLPPDVRVLEVSPTPSKLQNISKNDLNLTPFHPSLDAESKTYQYIFSVGEIHDPIRWRHVWHVENSENFNFDQAQQCAKLFLGTNNFEAFRGAFRGNERGKVQDTTCTIETIQIGIESQNTVTDGISSPFLNIGENGANHQTTTYVVTIKGDRFLYKMVRFMVGAIVAAGLDKISVASVHDALKVRNSTNLLEERLKRPNLLCAPSHGLGLIKVDYCNDIKLFSPGSW